MRNFRKKFGDHPAKAHVRLIWEARSRDEVIEKIRSFQSIFHDPKLDRWLNHKLTPWILAGLCIGQSKIPSKWWLIARQHTNIGESSHFQDNNFTGRKLSLLAAVLK